MELYHQNDQYLFFADNILPIDSQNLVLTDSNFSVLNEYDKTDHFQFRSNTMDRDKLNFDFYHNRYLYQPSLFYDSVYQITSTGNYIPFAEITMASSFSSRELKKIKDADIPFQEYKNTYDNKLHHTPIFNVFSLKDYLIIPFSLRRKDYLSFYHYHKQTVTTFKITPTEFPFYILRQSKQKFFLPISAYRVQKAASKVFEFQNQYTEKVNKYLEFAESIEPNDNISIMDFEWELGFIEKHIALSQK